MRRVKFIPVPGTPVYDAVTGSSAPTPDTPPASSDAQNQKKMSTSGRFTIFYRKGSGKIDR